MSQWPKQPHWPIQPGVVRGRCSLNLGFRGKWPKQPQRQTEDDYSKATSASCERCGAGVGLS